MNGLVLTGVPISICKCETPDFEIIWKTRMCGDCHRLRRTIDVVLCNKCGGRVPSEKIPKEIKAQEQDCGHKSVDREFESLRGE